MYEKGSSRIVTSSKMEMYHHRDHEERKNSLGHGREREENEAEIVNAAIQLDSHGPSSFLYTSMMLSVSPISFESFLQDIVL